MDGSLGWALYADHGGTFVMKGSEVFRQAVRLCSDSVARLLVEADCSVDDIAFLVPHQANQRIIEAIMARLGVPEERCLSVVEETGNTSAASIPLALDAAVGSDRVHAGDSLVMAGFGAGMAWGSMLVRMG
jgi:3-oxoacyl-[acyl-carrier-protein] synthase-3